MAGELHTEAVHVGITGETAQQRLDAGEVGGDYRLGKPILPLCDRAQARHIAVGHQQCVVIWPVGAGTDVNSSVAVTLGDRAVIDGAASAAAGHGGAPLECVRGVEAIGASGARVRHPTLRYAQ